MNIPGWFTRRNPQNEITAGIGEEYTDSANDIPQRQIDECLSVGEAPGVEPSGRLAIGELNSKCATKCWKN